MSDKIKIGVIVGPTAVGKTAAAVECALRMNAEIISADSIQIYKELDIGSAKPTREEMRGVVHHLIDFYGVDDEKFSVAEFQRRARSCIRDIAQRGKFPLVAGGTGLYVNSLVYPLDFTATPADEEYRSELNELEDATPGALHELLKKADPAAANRLHPNDRKRLIRALEVVKNTGSTVGGDFINEAKRDIPYEPVMVGLTMPREKLYARINTRVDLMMQAGLLEETDSLIRKGYDHALPALQGLGYKQLIAYRRGESTLDEAVEQIKMETRRFAKRQLTWFRRDKRINWVDMAECGGIKAAADRICAIMKGEG